MSAKDKKQLDTLDVEEFYQITENILSSFPKFRLPLPLFRYKQEVGQLQPFIQRDQRLSNEQITEMFALCNAGDLFVSRKDFPIYSKHIVNQLDLILIDKHLRESEKANICIQGLHMRLSNYLEQPVKPNLEALLTDVLVFTEFIWTDRHRLKLFVRRLNKEHSLVNHSLNTLFVGLWILCAPIKNIEDLVRKDFNRIAFALLLHDAGISKIPSFILNKVSALKQEEKEKIPPHTLVGSKMAQNTDLGWEELTLACMEHHERIDGSGYPRHIRGDQISKVGRLCAVADSFSAMISKRSYAEPKSMADAVNELCSDARYDQRFTTLLRGILAFKPIEVEGADQDDEDDTEIAPENSEE